MSRFSIEQVEAAHKIIHPVFLHTPQYECETLGEHFGNQVTLKIETLNPVRSFKGRGADLLIRRTTAKRLICASAGNFGQAMAYACRERGIQLTVYAAVSANPFKIARMKALGANVVLNGVDFDAAKIEAKKTATDLDVRFVEDSLDIETVIGAATIALELRTTGKKFDFVVAPLGNGALVNGIGRVCKTYLKEAKVVAVQSSGAPAMIESWKAGKIMTHNKIDTIADGIGVRMPVPEALADMNGMIDVGLLINEEHILAAMKLIYRHTGLAVEPSGAVGIAALIAHPRTFKGKEVAVVLTGGNLTDEQMEKWFC